MEVSSFDETKLGKDIKSESYNSSLQDDENVQILSDQERGSDSESLISIYNLPLVSFMEEEKFHVYYFENGEIIQNLTYLEEIKLENSRNQDDVFVETYEQPSSISPIMIDMDFSSFSDIRDANKE